MRLTLEQPEHLTFDIQSVDEAALNNLQTTGACKTHVFSDKREGVCLQPRTAEQTAQLLALSSQWQQALVTSPDEVWALETPVWLDTGRLKNILEYEPDDLVIRVEPGVTFGQLNTTLIRNRQKLALSYPDDMRIGQAVAEDRASLEAGFLGFPRDIILGTEIATLDGRLTKSGASVVKNVTGYDLNKLYVGSQNTLGVLTAVTLKLMPRPLTSAWLRFSLEDWLQGLQIISELAQAPLTACELWQSRDQNPQLTINLSGDPRWVNGVQDELRKLRSFQAVSIAELSFLREPERQAVFLLEFAFPVGAVEAVLDLIETCRTELQIDWIQVRPQAGLGYLGLQQTQTFDFVVLEKLTKRLAQLFPAFLAQDILRIKKCPLNLRPLLPLYNLSQRPAVLSMSRKLKTLYDPHYLLRNPYLPITPEGYTDPQGSPDEDLPDA